MSRQPRLSVTEQLGSGYRCVNRGDWEGAATAFRAVTLRKMATPEERMAALEGYVRACIRLRRPVEAQRVLGALPGQVRTVLDVRRQILGAQVALAAGQMQVADKMMLDVSAVVSGVRDVPASVLLVVYRWAGEALIRRRQLAGASEWFERAVEQARRAGDEEQRQRCEELLRVAQAKEQR